MGYKLLISEYADELLDNLIDYLIYHLKNKQAAKHLLDGIDSIYSRLQSNPFQFAFSLACLTVAGIDVHTIREKYSMRSSRRSA